MQSFRFIKDDIMSLDSLMRSLSWNTESLLRSDPARSIKYNLPCSAFLMTVLVNTISMTACERDDTLFLAVACVLREANELCILCAICSLSVQSYSSAFAISILPCLFSRIITLFFLFKSVMSLPMI